MNNGKFAVEEITRIMREVAEEVNTPHRQILLKQAENLEQVTVFMSSNGNGFDPQKYLTKIKDKDYLEVKYRVHWFRLEHKNWSIKTSVELLDIVKEVAVVKADIFDDTGKHLSSGMKMEYKKNFEDYIEKAETGSIGRALACLGYGTLQCFDLDEGRIVDSPVTPSSNRSQSSSGENKISEGQRKRLWAISNANQDLITSIIKEFGYSSSKDILIKHYEQICNIVESKAGKRE